MKPPRYTKTDKELARELGVAPATIATWRRDHAMSIPHNLPDGRRDVVAWQTWRRNKAAEQLGDGDLRDEKLKREIRLLDIEIEERLSELKPMTEWLSEVREIATITRAGLQQFVAWVAAEIRTPEAYKKANEIAERTCKDLAQRVTDATSKNG